MKDRKPLVYLAGPYTQGDQALNVRSQMRLMSELMTDGIVVPYAPLLSHFVQFVHPHSWHEWMEHSDAMLLRCDAMIRCPAKEEEMNYFQEKSKGADLEEEFCKKHGIPVYQSKEELYEWMRTQ